MIGLLTVAWLSAVSESPGAFAHAASWISQQSAAGKMYVGPMHLYRASFRAYSVGVDCRLVLQLQLAIAEHK